MEEENEEWQRNLAIMVFVQFIVGAGFNMMNPFLPLFISEEMGMANSQQVALWSGIIASIPGLFGAIFSPIWGNVGDKIGRKPMVLRSCLAITASMFLVSLSTNIYQLAALRMVQGVFAGFNATALSLVASKSPREKLTYSLGWLQTGQVLGVVAGPFIGGVVADLTSYRQVFQLNALLAGISAFLVWRFVREKFIPSPVSQKLGMLAGFSNIFHLEAMGALFLVLLLTQFSVRSVEPVIPLLIREMVGRESPALNTITGSVFAVSGITQALAVVFITRFVRAWGYKHLLLATLLGTALAYFPQGLVHSPGQLLLVRLAVGLFLGGVLPVANALIGLHAPDEVKGQVYGVASSAIFLGNFSGPLAGGIVVAFLGTKAIFFLTSALLLFNAWWVYHTVGSDNKKETCPSAGGASLPR